MLLLVVWSLPFQPLFRKQVAAHDEGGAAEAPRHRDRKVAIALVGRECRDPVTLTGDGRRERRPESTVWTVSARCDE